MPREPIPKDVLLDDLRALADDLGHTPTYRDVDEYSDRSPATYSTKFPTYTTAVAQIGLIPKDWYPLTNEEIHQFNHTAVSKQPREALPAVFAQFLPVPKSVYFNFNTEWMITLADDHILRIPPSYSPSSEELEIKIPSTWVNPHTGSTEQTQLASLIEWWFADHGSMPQETSSNLRERLYRIAADSDLSNTRPMETIRSGSESREERVPRVSFKDLRHTHGVHLARNGASREWIARRMGLDRPEQAEVYFALLDNHDEY
jgi:hypothetical protein